MPDPHGYLTHARALGGLHAVWEHHRAQRSTGDLAALADTQFNRLAPPPAESARAGYQQAYAAGYREEGH